MKKLLTVVGARPQFVKCAVVSRLLVDNSQIQEQIIHTGQHYDDDMSKIFFDQLKIPKPTFQLNIQGRHHGVMTGGMMGEIEEIMMDQKPEGVLVYGDTNSTLAGALAASKLHIPIFHVEAGLRSYNRKMPEEINRVLVDHLSQKLYCSTKSSIENLGKEGIEDGIVVVGDLMFDAALFAKQNLADVSHILSSISSDKPLALCTIHRAENTETKQALEKVFAYLDDMSRDFAILFPMHPRTAAKAKQYGLELPKLNFFDPIGYFEIHALLAQSQLLITDSGGMQKEAYFHHVPCITVRTETEWIETIENGWNRLWANSEYSRRQSIEEYGDGKCGEKIVQDLVETL